MAEPMMQTLHNLGIRLPEQAVLSLCAHVTENQLSFIEGLKQLIALEQQERETRNLKSRLKLAKLGLVKALDQFDWQHPRQIDQALYRHLCDTDFIKSHQNVLLRGPSGVGKTELAKNLGMEAIKRGYTVRFETLATLLSDLMQQESLPAIQRRLKLYTRPTLLIIDELGYLPCDNQAADMLFNVLRERHEQRATVITTNLSFKQWGQLFQGAACMTALVDRFAQHCHILDIDGDSWRKTHGLQTKAQNPG